MRDNYVLVLVFKAGTAPPTPPPPRTDSISVEKCTCLSAKIAVKMCWFFIFVLIVLNIASEESHIWWLRAGWDLMHIELSYRGNPLEFLHQFLLSSWDFLPTLLIISFYWNLVVLQCDVGFPGWDPIEVPEHPTSQLCWQAVDGTWASLGGRLVDVLPLGCAAFWCQPQSPEQPVLAWLCPRWWQETDLQPLVSDGLTELVFFLAVDMCLCVL